MADHVKVVEFPVQAKLNDIPGRLRWLAEQYESGDSANRLPDTLVIIERHDDDKLDMRCFGECPTDMEVPGILYMALNWWVERLKRLSSTD